MVITRESLIGFLTMDLELAEAAAVQYINHAVMLTGITSENIIKTLKAYACENIEHATTLADQINDLGGSPGRATCNVHASNDNEEMLLYDLEDEEDAVWRYTIRIEQAEQLKELGLAKQLRAILRSEQQHAMYLKRQLRAIAREKECLGIGIVGSLDFSQKWVEKAVNVPIRIKKQR